ncbi:MAG: carboxymuconolactone decarboxylase family protein [Streptosporangiaceae bacterium]
MSQINGCSVCVDMHARELKEAGEKDERIWGVGAWRESPYFGDAERAAPLASRIRAASWSGASILSNFVETRPSTTTLSSGTSLSAVKEPERSSSYSSRKTS